MRRTSTPNLQWSRSGLDCGDGGKELVSTRLSLFRSRRQTPIVGCLAESFGVPVSSCVPERSQGGAHQAGLSMDGSAGFGAAGWNEGL